MFDGVPEEDGPIVPEGWTPTTLGEVVPPPRPKIDSTPDSDLAFIGMEHIDAHSFTLNGQDQLRNFKSQASHFLPGEVLYGRLRPYLNKVHKARFEGAASAEFLVLTASERIDADFLRFLLHQMRFVQFANERSSGDRPRVKFDDIAEFEFALPPLADQRRIVSRIEELFSQVEAGERAIGAARRGLARYRRSVLHAAVTGALTEDWRAANPDPEEDGEAESNTPSGWRNELLGSLTALVTSGSRGWSKYYSDDGPYFVRAQDINTEWLDLEGAAHVTLPDGVEGSRTRLRPSDILVTITGANVTKTALTPPVVPEAYVSQHVGLVRLIDTDHTAFVYRYITAPTGGQKQLLEMAYGAGKPGLSLKNLKELLIPLPPAAEQAEIVSRIDEAFSRADAAEATLDAQARAARALKQSVLKAAFAGQLA